MNSNKSPTSFPSEGPPENQLGSALLTPEVAEGMIRLLCSGARLENEIPLSCYLLEGKGDPRRLAQATPEAYRSSFCNRANALKETTLICRQWYEKVARACWESGPVFATRVMVCPFGLSVMVAPVACRGAVKAVLFTGDWRESGGEGIIYHCLREADIPQKQRAQLEKHIPAAKGLISQEIDQLKGILIPVVRDVSRIIRLMYQTQYVVRERALTQVITDAIAALPSDNLREACAAAGTMLESIRQVLGVQFVVLFTNVGTQDRLQVSASAGLGQGVVDGLCIEGAPTDVIRSAGQWIMLPPREREKWIVGHLSRTDGRSVPSILGKMEDIAPVELGTAYCGLLGFGPFVGVTQEQQASMSIEDRHQLVETASNSIRNGLQGMAKREDVAAILMRFSHILRGPLMGLQGAVEGLQDYLNAGEMPQEEIEGIAEDIQNEVEDIARQAELLVEADKMIRSQRREAYFQSAPLATLADQVSQGLRSRMKSRGMSLGSLKHLRALPMVEFDWSQMRVVFANLLHNACKYAHNNSSIDFSGELVKVHGRPGVRVGISDFGTGIHPDEIEDQIWKPGFRGSIRDLRRDIQGTGMGLAVCRDIVVKVHSGRIWARCTERGGKRGYQHCLVELFVELPIKQTA